MDISFSKILCRPQRCLSTALRDKLVFKTPSSSSDIEREFTDNEIDPDLELCTYGLGEMGCGNIIVNAIMLGMD